MTISDNETLQTPPEPPRPRIVQEVCPFCAGAGKLPRVYRGSRGEAVNVLGKCTGCVGAGYVLTEVYDGDA
jgi:hypothetical protein